MNEDVTKLGVGVILVGVGLLAILPTALAERQIDLLDKCKPAESGKCFSDENGTVESADSAAVRVLYDDGRKSAKLFLAGETYPLPRMRIRIERWNGDIVSIYEPATELRYRTLKWPNAEGAAGWLLIIPGTLLFAWGVASGSQKLVQAARSNGKPRARGGARNRAGRTR